ncbi:hypothetical protein E2C01_099077 [Portunus trituberculatus]|uniref:Uncharacterized protein n=1 Tax=Portunus trituberculatus TaxID=210409 RepID=A0A5B7KDX6_PORTR|nr:hypothetical protein [Portunus trituberculatus]
MTRINTSLRLLEMWGQRWQVTFAHHKTQLLVVSRTRQDIRLLFNGAAVIPQEEVSILGYDSKLTFKTHIAQLARTAAGKLASLRRISWLLDRRGESCSSRLRSAPHSSILASPGEGGEGVVKTHLAKLDAVQRRVERIISEDQPEQPSTLQSLQHRRDVAGLTTLYKLQQRTTVHLQQLQQPLQQEVQTRGAVRTPSSLIIPRSHTTHHHRQFVPRYVRLWNTFLAGNKCQDDLSVAECGLQKFKVCVNAWLFHL